MLVKETLYLVCILGLTSTERFLSDIQWLWLRISRRYQRIVNHILGWSKRKFFLPVDFYILYFLIEAMGNSAFRFVELVVTDNWLKNVSIQVKSELLWEPGLRRNSTKLFKLDIKLRKAKQECKTYMKSGTIQNGVIRYSDRKFSCCFSSILLFHI